ncbi:uncharacterized protein HKW66_Vig0248070 [Vigna angularis]|uniref:UspA domain-containing protein n=1 Tax=Phaseolus angularis TaxID=3914 RepID=A0A8T0KT88_PHAAN|nr:uncharacterized protein HKW66_Vig0248070 [Vigna angularis]
MTVNRARTLSNGPLITSFRVQSSSWFSFTPDPPPLPPWVSPDLVRPFCYFLNSPTFFFNSIQNPSLVYVGAAEILPIVDSDLRKIAARVVDSARQLCIDKSVDDVTAEVVEGDPRNVLCDAVEKYHAAVLVVGSHGYGAIKRAVLGSVSDYCAHHAHCTVMIVKKPKIKH